MLTLALKELEDYVQALKACRDMTGTLPENTPERLDTLVKNVRNEVAANE